MTPETLTLRGWRNTPFPPDELAFALDGVAVDLTGKTAAMDVRAIAGTGPALISLDTTVSTSADGIRFTDAAGGILVIQVDQASMQAAWDAALAAGRMLAGESAPLVYDLLITDADGVIAAWLEGDFIIQPGVTL